MWKQHELTDGTYDFWDLVDMNTALSIRDENQFRAQEAAARDAQR
jgi:hypothetical protein